MHICMYGVYIYIRRCVISRWALCWNCSCKCRLLIDHELQCDPRGGIIPNWLNSSGWWITCFYSYIDFIYIYTHRNNIHMSIISYMLLTHIYIHTITVLDLVRSSLFPSKDDGVLRHSQVPGGKIRCLRAQGVWKKCPRLIGKIMENHRWFESEGCFLSFDYLRSCSSIIGFSCSSGFWTRRGHIGWWTELMMNRLWNQYHIGLEC